MFDSKQYAKDYYQKYKDVLKQKRDLNPSYRETLNKCKKRWNQANLEKCRLYKIRAEQKRRFLLATVGFVSEEMREVVYNRDGYTCLSCDALDNLTVDHIVPISKGGQSDINNLQTLCALCNSRKQQRIEDFR